MSNLIDINGKMVDVEQHRTDWVLALMTKGVIANLTISRWRATSPLRADELGLKFADTEACSFMKKYVTLGSEKLLPPEILSEFNYVEKRARDNLDNYSFKTVWGKFIPYTAFSEWDTENKQIEADFYELAKKFGEKYIEIISVVRSEYRKMAKDVWIRMHPGQIDAPPSFVEEFIDRVISKIPPKNQIDSMFSYSVEFFYIPMPSMIANDFAKANEIQRQDDIKSHEANLEKEIKTEISKRYMIKKNELIDSFLEATVTSMRSYVGELCDGVLMSLNTGGKKEINKTQINKIKKMISKVRTINFYDDKEIRIMLNELETEIDKFKGQRNADTIVQKLQDIVTVGQTEYVPIDFNPAIGSLEI